MCFHWVIPHMTLVFEEYGVCPPLKKINVVILFGWFLKINYCFDKNNILIQAELKSTDKKSSQNLKLGNN